MKAIHLTAMAGALALAGIAPVYAQDHVAPGFYGAIGYNNVSPQSNTGVLAGAFRSSIGSDSEPTLTLGYRFPQGWGVEGWLPITKFQHNVSLNGAQSASIKHMPILLTAQYHFLQNQALQPFVGLGYGWVNVSDVRTSGPIAGTNLNVQNGSGVVGQLGVDYFVTPNVFVRADAKYFNWSSNVQLNGAAIGHVDVNPWIYGVSVGYKF